jgi:hypothetical protein
MGSAEAKMDFANWKEVSISGVQANSWDMEQASVKGRRTWAIPGRNGSRS